MEVGAKVGDGGLDKVERGLGVFIGVTLYFAPNCMLIISFSFLAFLYHLDVAASLRAHRLILEN